MMKDHGSNTASRTGLRGFDVRAREHHPRILLAEDDDDFRSLLARWLEVDGYRVTNVASGSALLGRVAATIRSKDPPALIIADDRMPGILGSRALRQLREKGWSTPLVLITAFATDELIAEVGRFGVKVLRKPFEIDDLRTLVGWLVPMIDSNACVACGSTNDVDVVLLDRGSAMFCKGCREQDR